MKRMKINVIMKNTIKIMVLSVSFATVSTLILIFLNSIMKPPTKEVFSNQYLETMNDFINEFDKCGDITLVNNKLDDTYNIFDELYRLYDANTLLDSTEKIIIKEKFVSTYTPKFASACILYFSHMCWNDDVLSMMRTRNEQLRSLSPYLYGKDKDIQTVKQVLFDYDSAVSLLQKEWVNDMSKESSYRSLTDEYKKKAYLRNNKCLCDTLESSMNRHGRCHYEHLKKRVEKLDSYFELDNDKYDDLSSAVVNEIENYKKNAEKVYGELLNVDLLEKDAADWYSKAIAYYSIMNEF